MIIAACVRIGKEYHMDKCHFEAALSAGIPMPEVLRISEENKFFLNDKGEIVTQSIAYEEAYQSEQLLTSYKKGSLLYSNKDIKFTDAQIDLAKKLKETAKLKTYTPDTKAHHFQMPKITLKSVTTKPNKYKKLNIEVTKSKGDQQASN